MSPSAPVRPSVGTDVKPSLRLEQPPAPVVHKYPDALSQERGMTRPISELSTASARLIAFRRVDPAPASALPVALVRPQWNQTTGRLSLTRRPYRNRRRSP